MFLSTRLALLGQRSSSHDHKVPNCYIGRDPDWKCRQPKYHILSADQVKKLLPEVLTQQGLTYVQNVWILRGTICALSDAALLEFKNGLERSLCNVGEIPFKPNFLQSLYLFMINFCILVTWSLCRDPSPKSYTDLVREWKMRNESMSPKQKRWEHVRTHQDYLLTGLGICSVLPEKDH